MIVTAVATSRYHRAASLYVMRVRAILGHMIALVCSLVAEPQQWVARQQPYARGQHGDVRFSPLELDEHLGEAEGGADRQRGNVPEQAHTLTSPRSPYGTRLKIQSGC